MLLAFPGASIVSFDSYPVREVSYDHLEQIGLMRRFLERPDAFLRHL
jgi:predicted ATPase